MKKEKENEERERARERKRMKKENEEREREWRKREREKEREQICRERRAQLSIGIKEDLGEEEEKGINTTNTFLCRNGLLEAK